MTPIILITKATKTNGRGILNFEEGVSDIMLKAAAEGLALHALRFDYEFTYTDPHNTTDPRGLRHFYRMITQFSNTMNIQFYFNMEEKLSKTRC